MTVGLWFFFGWISFVTLTGIIFLIYGLSSGQFKDVESAKYRMLEDREPEPWPDEEEVERD
jgi:nitrogen fixation-related uncharacterized protein